MKKALCLFLAMIMALSLVACGGGEQTPPAADAEMSTADDLNKDAQVDETKTYKEKLTIAHMQKHSSLDPQGDSLGVTCTMDELVYNQLVKIPATSSELVGELAESWNVSEDGLTWTFNLRKDVTFHNGEPLTADDVLFTYERAVESGKSTSSITAAIKEVVVVDEHTVQYITNTPNMDFPYLMTGASGAILNRDACEADPEKGWEIGTNGWMIKEWTAGENAVFTKYEDSWAWNDVQTPTKEIEIVVLTEAAARAMAVEAGEADACTGVSLVDITKYDTMEGLDYFVMPGMSVNFLAFSTDCKLAQNEDFRKAVAFALDREVTLSQIAYNGYSPAAQTIWGLTQYGYYDQFEDPLTYDLERAMKHLEASGYNGEEFELSTTTAVQTLTEGVQAELIAKLGMNATVNVTDTVTIDQMVADKKLDAFVFSLTTTVYGDGNRRIMTAGGNANRGRYENPEILALLDKAVAETDDAVRQDYYKQIQEIINDEMWIIPLLRPSVSGLYNDGLQGVEWYASQNHNYTYAFCEE